MRIEISPTSASFNFTNYKTYSATETTTYQFWSYENALPNSDKNLINFWSTGKISATSFNATSDYRIKTNVVDIPPEFTIDTLKPKYYYNKTLQKNDIGFIAHEVQEHFPFLVSGEKDDDEMQSLNYNGFVGLLVHEIQQLKKELSAMKTEINTLRSLIV